MSALSAEPRAEPPSEVRTEPPTTVSVQGLQFTFPGGVRALDGVDLGIAQGEFVSLVGPSGCGKSTLLRLIAGLLKPGNGKVEIEGRSSPAWRRATQGVSFVFQSATLLPWRSVEKNVRLPLELRGNLTAESRQLVTETLDMVGLGDFRRAYPHQLSGGMQMRVSLARALVTRPQLLLLDEPFGALDDITRQRLNEELLELWERERMTAVFVTHNVSEAVFLSERVLVMKARPGLIMKEFKIGFGHPRNADIRSSPEFAKECGEIGEALRESFS